MKRQSSQQFKLIAVELVHHLPYSMFGVVFALIIMGFLTFFAHIVGATEELPHGAEELFHIFHPAHVLFSAVATTAMFFKHDERNIWKGVAVGFFGSVLICGVSDIFIPFAGGLILGSDMAFHVCILEEPMLVLPFAVYGVLAGLAVTKSFERSTELSHGTHVFLSSAASLLYLIAYGLTDWMHLVGGVFLVTVIAVIFPCCLSDIVFPMMCTHKYCSGADDEPLKHRH